MNVFNANSDFERLPTRHHLGLAFVLSLIIAILMTISALVGLLYPSVIYPTQVSLLYGVPTDVVNLVLGVPILLGSMWFARRGRLAGLLCWPGALAYALYIYLVYTIGLPFNARFLLNLALVPLSGYTLIGLVASIDGEAVRKRLNGTVPARTAGGILVVLVALFVPIQVIDVVHTILSQASIDRLELSPFMADVMVLSPMWLVGGILSWRRKALGYVAGAGLLLVGSMLFVGLSFVLVFPAIYVGSPIDWAAVVMMLVMGLVCFVPFVLFVRGPPSS